MRRFVFLLALVAIACARARAVDIYDCYNGSSEQGGNRVTVNGIQTNQYVQQSFPTTTVTVYIHNTTTLATPLFADGAGAQSLANPFASSAHGVAFFCAADGRYDVKYSGTTITTPFTVSDIHLCFSCAGSGGSVGPGTVNTIAKFTTTTNVGDSSVTDNGVAPTQATKGISAVTNGGFDQAVISANGVTANALVCVDATVTTSKQVTTCPTSTTKAIGVADTGGTTGNVDVASIFYHACIFDGQTVIGDLVGPSTTVAGDCEDFGAALPTGTQRVGRVSSLNSGAGTAAQVDLGAWDLFAPGSSGSTGTVLPCSGSNCDAYYPTATNIVAGDTLATDDGAGNKTAKSLGLTDVTQAGFYYLKQGAIPAAAPANTLMFYTPTSVTTYSVRWPSAACTSSQVWQVSSTTTDTNGNTIDLMGCLTLGAGTGTVTSFSAGNLAPLFTTSVATATTTPALTFSLSNAAAHTYFGNPTGGSAAPAFSSLVTGDLPAVVIRRTCMIVIGADNGSVLANADIGPQLEQCQITQASTVVEIDVTADAGTPNVIVSKRHCTANPCASNFTVTNLLSGALATAASGGSACSNTGGTAGLDTFTTCTNTLQNTSLAIGDYLETVSATAGGTAHRMSIAIYFTVN
jgi:hypothetical protein